MLFFEHVSYLYPGSDEPALTDVTFAVAPGEHVVLLGSNGSGKSTLARLANGLLLPNDGTVHVNELTTAEKTTIRQLRSQVGVLSQNPDNQIISMTVLDEVAFGPENLGMEREQIIEAVTKALEALGLTGFENRDPSTLSGGEKQRLNLAALLAMDPGFLVMDEPTSMLDRAGRVEVRNAIKSLHARGHGILHITHDLNMAREASRVLVLKGGRLVFAGHPGTLLNNEPLLFAYGLKVDEAAVALRAVVPTAAGTGAAGVAAASEVPGTGAAPGVAAASEATATGAAPDLTAAPEAPALGIAPAPTPDPAAAAAPEAPAPEAEDTPKAAEPESPGTRPAQPPMAAPRSLAPAAPPSAFSAPPAIGAPAAISAPQSPASAPSSPSAAQPPAERNRMLETLRPITAPNRWKQRGGAFPSIFLDNIFFTYGIDTELEKQVLKGVSYVLNPGSYTLISGSTGEGKSTLLRIIAGLMRPTLGSVSFSNGTKVFPSAVGIVFQHPENQLFAATVEEELAFGPGNLGLLTSKEVRANIVREALDGVGLDPKKYFLRSPFSLSGGEMRRVAIASILAMRPTFLLLDEPTAGLDAAGRAFVHALIAQLVKATTGVIVVSHDIEEFEPRVHSHLVLKDGRLWQR